MDPFVVLGVGRDASPAEIRQAFADGVRAAHPDAGGLPAAASGRLAELIEARDVALHGPKPAVGTPAQVRFYAPPRGLERLALLLLSGRLRPKRSDRDLR